MLTMRACATLTLLLAGALFPSCGLAQDRALAVAAGAGGAAQITLSGGRTITIPGERGQVGISDGQIASDGSVGWLAEFRAEGVSYPIARTLIIWRAGKIIRRFHTAQAFYSWAFYAHGRQVAYHDGPLHGEPKSHCELHEVAGGRTIAVWEGDLTSGSSRPVWTGGLTH
jgi:hypothetical protein